MSRHHAVNFRSGHDHDGRFNPGGKYSIGGGLSEGAASLHDFYLSLAKQATPVIEVGAAKKITVIISEGKELEIREIGGEPF